MTDSRFAAFSDAPDAIMALMRANLNDYAAARGAELGITMPVIKATGGPHDTGDFYDYNPGPLVSEWRFQVFTEDGPLEIDAIGSDGATVKADLTMQIGVAGVDGDLWVLHKTVRAFVDAIVRVLADEAARNGEFVTLSSGTLSLPLPGEDPGWCSLAGGVKVLNRSAI